MKLEEFLDGSLWFREKGYNDGPIVRACQAVNRGKPGEAWCAHYVSLALLFATDGKPPFALSGGCDELLKAARAAGLERDHPVVPGLFFVMKSPKDAVHVGFNRWRRAAEFGTQEGNTVDPQEKDPAKIREGNGVFRRTRDTGVKPYKGRPDSGYTYISLEGKV